MKTSGRVSVASIVIATTSLLVGGAAFAQSSPADQWAPKFCTTLNAWATALKADHATFITEANAAIPDVKALQALYVKLLGKTVSETERATAAFAKAGTPSSANGRAIQTALLKAFQKTRNNFAALDAKTKKMSVAQFTADPPGDSATNTSAQPIDGLLGRLYSLDTSGALAQAVQNAPSCAFLNSPSG